MRHIQTFHPSPKRRGSALLASVTLLTVLGVMTIILLQGVVDSTKSTTHTVSKTRAEAASSSVIALAADQIWSGFERELDATGQESQPWVFHNYLDSIGLLDEAAAADPTGLDLMPLINLPAGAEGTELDGVLVNSVRVVRSDDWNSTRLSIEADVAVTSGQGANARMVSSNHGAVFIVEPPNFDGLNFALLANNVNCILCHTTIDDAERFFNTDTSRYGEFDRVRVGSLESLQVRADPDSVLAGTLYLGGNAVLEDGSAITNWGAMNFESHELDAHGRQKQNAWGEPTLVPLSAAPEVDPGPLENLYTNYLDGGTQVDGDLPGSFPPPFPDDGGYDYLTQTPTPELADNRIVDSNEFLAAVAGYSGSIAGGTISLLDPSTAVASTSDLDALMAGNSTNVSGIQEGNVYLHGTEANPILLDGEVAIDGDVILSGYVKGTGTLMVSGNVYMPSDVKYVDAANIDGERIFGTAADGTANALAIGIGNNAVLGDPTHPSFGAGTRADGTPATDFNFILEELAIFNRMEWIKTQPQLPGKTTTEIVGYDEVEREVYDYLTIEEEVPVDVKGWVGTGVFEDKPVYELQKTGTEEVPVYEQQQTGTTQEPIYQWVHHPADPPEPYGSPWSEKVIIGYEDVPVYTNVQVGTETQDVFENVQTGTVSKEIKEYVVIDTIMETQTRQEPIEPPTIVIDQVPIYAEVTPMHDNSAYVPGYKPRFYAQREGTPVPIFNKDGYYEPASGLWLAEERAGGWDDHKLTLADPTDSSDPLLYDASGQPIAVVSTLDPQGGWMSMDLLSELIQRQLGPRDDTEAIQIDATVYSSNAVLGVVPARNQAGVNGELHVNGSLVAADVGLLAPSGTRVLYDRRGRDLLRIPDTSQLTMRRSLWVRSAP